MKMQVRSLIAGSMLMFAASAVQAELEEITVSAERKDENIQDVPIAVSAFSMDDLQNLQIDITSDLGAAVPNMQTYTVTSNASAMQVFMRGAGVQNPGFNASESPVGIYMDNVYRGRLATANFDLADIERIEVLRGPQGTLYGRNTIAGALKVITRTPEDEFWADASVGYGNYETTKISASVGGPLAEGWGASVAAMYNNREEGWIDRGTTGGRSLGEYKNKAMRGKLNYFGGDIFGATLSIGAVNAQNDGYNGIPYGPNYAADPATGLPSAPGTPVEGFYDSLVPDETVGYGKVNQLNASLDLSWTWDVLSVQSITSAANSDDQFAFDLNGGAAQFGGVGTPISTGVAGLYVQSDANNKTYSQEFVFRGDVLDEKVSWIGGLFYMNEQGDQTYSPGFVTAPAAGNSITETVNTDTKSYAVYAEATWNVTEALSATLGGRWTKDEKTYNNKCTTDVGTGLVFLSCTDITNASADWSINLAKDFEKFTPRFMLEYQLNDVTNLYVSYSEGFQAGGFQTLCFGVELCAQQIYQPQDVKSYEVGVKKEWLDRTLRTNLAVFHADYSDMQQTGILIPGVPLFPVLNVGEARVNGIELEMNWVPTDGLNLYLIGAYADDEINPATQANLPNTSADRLPGLPEETLRIGGDYRTGIFSDWDILVGADVNHVGDYYATINDTLLVPDYTRLNGFIGIDQPDGNWSLILSGKNLTDSEDYISGIAGGGTNIRTPLPPLEFMLNLKYRFANN